MEEQIYIYTINELSKQLSDKTISEAEYKARFALVNNQLESVSIELEHFKAVLASDTALKDLFEEAREKLEVVNNDLE